MEVVASVLDVLSFVILHTLLKSVGIGRINHGVLLFARYSLILDHGNRDLAYIEGEAAHSR